MSNIIRPTFGQPRKPARADDDRIEVTTERVYGEAGDHRVCLVRDDEAPEGDVYKVVVGRLAGQEVSTVAILPATPEGEIDAEMVALAILRTLSLIEEDDEDPDSA
ncbi:hypothetical protein [Methylobacterium sp. 10]|uniref:hypothetical protein n=1 Tax=Methylobacterium sp. 10 TaxID=1101191 RepID=UPI0004818923|nr:hypothetical protein [Methylobacterium sp. 10]